jgi:putative transposase
MPTLFRGGRNRNQSVPVGCLNTLALLRSFRDAAMRMRKCLSFNLLKPTSAKRKLLRETYTGFLSIAREALSSLDGVKSRGQLHNKTYLEFRGKYGVASQLIIEATSYAWSIRKRNRKRTTTTSSSDIGRCVVCFDKRLFSFRETKRGNPVLTLRTNTKRIGLPVRRDGAYQRLQLHAAQGWEITSIMMKRSGGFLAVISKEMSKPLVRVNSLGVDVNSPRVAVSIVSPTAGILKQAYYGKDISTRQFNFEKRRAALQQYRDTVSRGKAGLKLRRLSRRQRNYVRTSIWALANEVVKLAITSNANIAIEKLQRLRKRRGEWSARSRRKVNRIPYGFFRHAIRHVAEKQRILVQEVSPKYTSQMCPNCGHTGKSNWRSYISFRCTACGYEANRDRVASLNIALRAAPPTNMQNVPNLRQFPEGSASVSRRVWQGEGFKNGSAK